jgi:AcrR family transcriptional regulator
MCAAQPVLALDAESKLNETSFMSRGQTPDETKQRILDAALEVFSTRGYGNSSIPAVARAANMAVGTIYIHFKDKSDLVNQLFRYWKDEKLEGIDFGTDADTPRERFRKAIRSYLAFGLAHGNALSFLESHYHAAYLDDESIKKTEHVVGRFISFVVELTEAGALRPDPPGLHLAILNGAAIGVLKQIWARHLEPTEELLVQTEVAIWSALRT